MPFADKRKFFAKASPGRPEPVPDAFRERKRSGMKVSRISKGLLLGLAVLLATSAFAANKGSVAVTDPVTVAGKQLAVGNYKLTWDMNKFETVSNATVRIAFPVTKQWPPNAGDRRRSVASTVMRLKTPRCARTHAALRGTQLLP